MWRFLVGRGLTTREQSVPCFLAFFEKIWSLLLATHKGKKATAVWGQKFMQSGIECWRPIPDFPQLYEVSNLGNVLSIKTGRCRLAQVSNSGYLCLVLCKNRTSYGRFIHRLVCSAFLDGYQDDLQVNHIDGNKKNNLLSNLEMVTPSENRMHSFRVLGNKAPILYGYKNGWSRPVLQVSMNGDLVSRFECRMDAVRLGFNAACITECCNGTQKTHKGYIWRHVDA